MTIQDQIRDELSSLVLAVELKNRKKLEEISNRIVLSYCQMSDAAEFWKKEIEKENKKKVRSMGVGG